MSEINLLPQELKPSNVAVKFSTKLKKFAILFTVLAILVLVFYLGFDFVLKKRISDSLSSQKSLETQIKALEKTEQRLVLVKDRLDKINAVSQKPNANDEFARFNEVLTLFPEEVRIDEVEMNESRLDLKVDSDNLDNVASYLASVISSGKFMRVNLIFLSFNPNQGYSVGLSFPE